MTTIKLSRKGLLIWGICALFFTYEFMLRTLLGTFEHPLLYDLKLSLVSFSILSSTAYQTIYGIMQLPVGYILDKFGLKKMLFMAVLICAASVIGFSASHQFPTALVLRILMGFGSSFGFIALLIAVYDWLPRDKTGLFIGLSQFIGTMGPMAAAGPMNALADNDGIPWRVIFLALGGLGIVLSILVLCFVENNRHGNGKIQILKRPGPVKDALLVLIKQPQVWCIGLYSACIYFGIEYLSENSGKTFLMLHGYSSQSASNFITLSWLGYAIGCPLLGLLSDMICRRKSILLFAAMIGLGSSCLILFMADHTYFLLIGFLGLGIGASGQSVAFATMAEQCEAKYLALGLSFNNACIIMMASINAPLIAWILHKLAPSHDLLTIANYQSALSIITFFLGLSLIIGIFFIKETFCKSMRSATKLRY